MPTMGQYRCRPWASIEFFQIAGFIWPCLFHGMLTNLHPSARSRNASGIAMDIIPQIQDAFFRWIDSVAATVNGLLHRLQSNHEVRIIEEAPDTFTLRAPDAGRKSGLTNYRLRIANGAIKGQLPAEWAKMLRGSRAELVLRANRFLFRPLELPKRAAEFLDGIVRSQIDRLTPWSPGEAVFSWTPPVEASNEPGEFGNGSAFMIFAAAASIRSAGMMFPLNGALVVGS